MHWAWRHAFSYGNMLSGTIAHKLIGMRRMVDTTLRAATTEQWLRWITVAAVLVFLGYAASFWFFFVDDEAIPFVYAQNLLRGRGFSYNLIEGQVEGYSDFLHVFVAAAMLLVVKAADLPKYWVFFLGKALSLVCGVTLIWVASRILARLCTVRPSGTVCAMAFLALSGPLALWSCSSLETVAFAVLLALLLLGLVSAEHDDRLDWLTATAGAAAVLERIDGFVYVGILVGTFLVLVTGSRRRLWRRVVTPILCVFIAYNAFRLWYFGSLLSMPLASKVAYKLLSPGHIVIKAPAETYTHRFLDLYGWPIVALVVGCRLTVVQSVSRSVLALALATMLGIVYVSNVGDWMFGFRFFVFLLVPLSVLIAIAVSSLHVRSTRAAWMVTALAVGWFGHVANGFLQTYSVQTEHKPSGYTGRLLDPARHFNPFFEVVQEARKHVASGSLIAYNQAGFVPFMLDVDNIDDLGLCSRFYARLPTTDVFFTEVGRYSPLTDAPTVSAYGAYLLYQQPTLLIVRLGLLRNANNGHVPATLLAGAYQLAETTASDTDATYTRTAAPIDVYRSSPDWFLQNLAHVSYLTHATINAETLTPDQYASRFRCLYGDKSGFTVQPNLLLQLRYSGEDVPVREVYLRYASASRDTTVTIRLWSKSGTVVYTRTLNLTANRGQGLLDRLPSWVLACQLSLTAATAHDGITRLWLTDLRVQGQTPLLRNYVTANLPFPAPARKP